MQSQGANAVVTGASTGIGRAISLALAQHGVRVALVARGIEGLKETESLIHQSGGQASIFPTDLRDEQAINRLAASVLQAWGGVDILANVAGVWHNSDSVYYGPRLAETPPQQVNEVLDVGIRAPMLLTRLLVPSMVQKRQGKVINISGTFSSGGAGWLHYYVSKKAIEQFTIGLADELREHEIQVNCISPSDVATDALKRFFPDDAATALKPDDVAATALWLVTNPVANNITGQIIVVKNNAAY